jgi:hypothetical protein
MKTKWLILGLSFSITTLLASVTTSEYSELSIKPLSIVVGTDDDDYYVDPPETKSSEKGLSPAQKAMKKGNNSNSVSGSKSSENSSDADDSDDEDTDNEED